MRNVIFMLAIISMPLGVFGGEHTQQNPFVEKDFNKLFQVYCLDAEIYKIFEKDRVIFHQYDGITVTLGNCSLLENKKGLIKYKCETLRDCKDGTVCETKEEAFLRYIRVYKTGEYWDNGEEKIKYEISREELFKKPIFGQYINEPCTQRTKKRKK